MKNLDNRIVKQFDSVAMDSNQWIEHAQTLKFGATAILEKLLPLIYGSQPRGEIRVKMLGYVRTYMLLTGFAFENLLKAIVVRRRYLTQTVNVELRSMKTHKLTMLVKKLKLELTQEELQYLKRLEEYTIWGGRYPVPLDIDTYVDCRSAGTLSFRTDDPKMGDTLFNKLSESIMKK